MKGPAIQSKSLMAVGLGFICIAVGYFLYTNIWPSYTESQTRLDQTQLENQNLKKALSSMQKFIDDYKAIGEKASNVDLILPTKSSDLANFISNLSDLAGQSGVALAGFQVGDSVRESPTNAIQVVDVSFSSSGSYLSLKDFLLKMQNNLRLIDIYSLTMSAGQTEGAGTPILQYNIRLRTYYQQ